MKMGLLSRFFSGYTFVIGSHIRRQLEFLKEKAPPDFKRRQMDDLGCGDGRITLLLKEILLPTRVRGFDINPRLVKRVRDKGIEAEVRNIEKDMPRGELGVMWGVLHHLKDRQDCLERLKENYSLILIREPIKTGPTNGWELGHPLRKEEFECLIQECLAGSQVFYCGNSVLLFYVSPDVGIS
jgi:SAM-dependent methyltransferase